MTSSKKEQEIMIASLLEGWFDSIVKSPEIEGILSIKRRKIIKKERVQISNCASRIFLDKYDGINLLRNQDVRKIQESIINSIKECL